MSWVFLILAGLCEVAGVHMMNRFNQDRKWQTLVLLAAGFGISFICLTTAMQTIPMGTAYAVWTGIGTSGAAVLGMLVYGEPKSALRILCIVIILGSAVGLKLV